MVVTNTTELPLELMMLHQHVTSILLVQKIQDLGGYHVVLGQTLVSVWVMMKEKSCVMISTTM